MQKLTCDFVDGGAVGCLLSARSSFSPLSLDSSAGEKVYISCVTPQIRAETNPDFVECESDQVVGLNAWYAR